MIDVAPTIERAFLDFDALQEWVVHEAKCLSRLPISYMWQNGARFREDRFIGKDEYMLQISIEGLKALCTKIGYPMIALGMVQKRGLASEILNDLLESNIDGMSGLEFVVYDDAKSVDRRIIGIVSKSYFGYSNSSFLSDIHGLLTSFSHNHLAGFQFEEAFSVNTKTHIRFLSTHVSGSVTGKGGDGEDKTILGLEFVNSMVGDASLSINYFLQRLVCANGLILPAGRDSLARITHVGERMKFIKKVSDAFYEVSDGLNVRANYIEQLNRIDFSPRKLAELGLSNQIFDIIPRSKSTIIANEKSVLSQLYSRRLSREEEIDRERMAISFIPRYYAGPLSSSVFRSGYRDNVSMFDFINLFTEYAKKTSTSEKLSIQKRTGEFAEWIIQNQKKFD